MSAIESLCRELSTECFRLPKINGVCGIPGIKRRARQISFVAAESTIYTYLLQKKILIVQYACIVNIVIIIGIVSLIELKYVLSTPAAPGRHTIPSDHATVPHPTYTAAPAIPGE